MKKTKPVIIRSFNANFKDRMSRLSGLLSQPLILFMVAIFILNLDILA